MQHIHPDGWFPAGEPVGATYDTDALPDRPGTAETSPDVLRALLGMVFSVSVPVRLRMRWDEAAAMPAFCLAPPSPAEAVDEPEAAEMARLGASLPPALRAPLLNELACIALLAGELDEAEQRITDAAAAAGDAAQAGRARINRAVLAGLRGDARAALGALDDAERTLQGEGDTHERLLLLVNRAHALGRVDDRDAAEVVAADALRMARRVKTQEHWIATGFMAAALAAHGRGKRGEARSRLGEAVRGFARTGDALRQVQCHYHLGEIAYGGEDPIRAGTHYRDGLAVARQVGAQDAIELLTLRFEHR